MKPIWIVDDDPSIRFVLEKALAREHWPTRSFSHTDEVLQALADLDGADGAAPQVLVSDIAMPGGNGLDLLEQVHARLPGLPVIIMTAYSDLDSAVAAFQRGAFEYLPKPFDLTKAVELIRRALQEGQDEAAAPPASGAMPEMLGQARAMQDVFRAIGRLSQSQATVLITGESGAGKELVARALHRHSPCAQGPFVAINTAAIPKDLLESELFGHERGAFTGAQAQRRGRFEQAEGGTLFLDEIGDMPLDLQTRLLRVLSDGRFYRVGGHAPVKAHVRVIAATHQNLEQRVRDGVFREDLFHRLNVIRLRLPALRERREDIPLLARHFLQVSAQQLGVEAKRFSEAALQRLAQYAFPGNVRQLENICHWLTVMAPAQTISVQDLPPEVLETPPLAAAMPLEHEPAAGSPAPAGMPAEPVPEPAREPGPQPSAEPGWEPGPAPAALAPGWEPALAREALAQLGAGQAQVWDGLLRRFESTLIHAALQATHGRRREAAERLGIGRNTLTRKLQELGLEAQDTDKNEL
ncbi:MAG: nitrogen regulation protein NR(I) [Burkholderiales bacterium 68-12]|nr:MAG: nitrogen regulation protein NR(I) [Burkholderiales bacterium 68-12]